MSPADTEQDEDEMKLYDEPKKIIDLLESHSTKFISAGDLSGRAWEKGGHCRVYVTLHGRDHGYLAFEQSDATSDFDYGEGWASHVTGGARTEVDEALADIENFTGC